MELPDAIPLAVPFGFIVATAGLEEVHPAWLVILITEPSLNVPFPVNACEEPTATLAFAGVTAIEFSVALVTFNDPVATCPLNTAEMVTFPACMPVA